MITEHSVSPRNGSAGRERLTSAFRRYLFVGGSYQPLSSLMGLVTNPVIVLMPMSIAITTTTYRHTRILSQIESVGWMSIEIIPTNCNKKKTTNIPTIQSNIDSQPITT